MNTSNTNIRIGRIQIPEEVAAGIIVLGIPFTMGIGLCAIIGGGIAQINWLLFMGLGFLSPTVLGGAILWILLVKDVLSHRKEGNG